MAIKYWEFEDAPLKEKLKGVNVKDVAKLFYDNETEAYRFAALLLEVKKKGAMRLKEVPQNIPIATAKRYLDFAVQTGLLKHENNAYELTDRFSKPFRNIAAYIKAWMESDAPVVGRTPKAVEKSIRYISSIKGLPFDQVALALTSNTRRFFDISARSGRKLMRY